LGGETNLDLVGGVLVHNGPVITIFLGDITRVIASISIGNPNLGLGLIPAKGEAFGASVRRAVRNATNNKNAREGFGVKSKAKSEI